MGFIKHLEGESVMTKSYTGIKKFMRITNAEQNRGKAILCRTQKISCERIKKRENLNAVGRIFFSSVQQ